MEHGGKGLDTQGSAKCYDQTMCGRFTLTKSGEEIADELGVEAPPEPIPPRYNIAPTEQGIVVVNRVPPKLARFRWGLIPHWAKDHKIGHKMINARAESLAERSAFRGSLERKRCLVVADGFYEWRRAGKKRSTPFYVRVGGGNLFTMAGLWDGWKAPNDEVLRTFTIVTTDANELVSRIHDRMPVILPPEHREAWLAPEPRTYEELAPLLVPFAARDLEAYEVSTLVNKPGVEGPELVAPV